MNNLEYCVAIQEKNNTTINIFLVRINIQFIKYTDFTKNSFLFPEYINIFALNKVNYQLAKN